MSVHTSTRKSVTAAGGSAYVRAVATLESSDGFSPSSMARIAKYMVAASGRSSTTSVCAAPAASGGGTSGSACAAAKFAASIGASDQRIS